MRFGHEHVVGWASVGHRANPLGLELADIIGYLAGGQHKCKCLDGAKISIFLELSYIFHDKTCKKPAMERCFCSIMGRCCF